MRTKQLFLILALLCAMVQGAWAQASWDEVYAITNTTSANWTALTEGSTTGKTIGTAGATTYLHVTGNLTFSNSTLGGSGLTILGTVYLYVPQDVTVTCTGANASGQTGAGAGIEVALGNSSVNHQPRDHLCAVRWSVPDQPPDQCGHSPLISACPSLITA